MISDHGAIDVVIAAVVALLWPIALTAAWVTTRWDRRQTRSADYAKREAELVAMGSAYQQHIPDPTTDRHQAFRDYDEVWRS